MYNHKEYMREYNKKRALERKKYREEYPFQTKEERRKRNTEANKRYIKRNRAKTNLQKNAGNRVRYAIKTGKLVKTPCVVCGDAEYTVGHHQDYSKPYDVIWLCPYHHRAIHGRVKC